jgi:hypothetical protein
MGKKEHVRPWQRPNYAGEQRAFEHWDDACNRQLENQAPIEFIENGDLASLEMFLDAMSVRQQPNESLLHSIESFGEARRECRTAY